MYEIVRKYGVLVGKCYLKIWIVGCCFWKGIDKYYFGCEKEKINSYIGLLVKLLML